MRYKFAELEDHYAVVDITRQYETVMSLLIEVPLSKPFIETQVDWFNKQSPDLEGSPPHFT